MNNEPIKGQLCWFSDVDGTRKDYVGVFQGKAENGRCMIGTCTWRYCTPLTKQELAEFVKLAPDGEEQKTEERPGLPVIDWSKAPANAKSHAYNTRGVGMWLSSANIISKKKGFEWADKDSWDNPYIEISGYSIDYKVFNTKDFSTVSIRPGLTAEQQPTIPEDPYSNENQEEIELTPPEEPRPGEVLHEEKHDSSSAFISAGGKLLNDDLIDEVFDKRK